MHFTIWQPHPSAQSSDCLAEAASPPDTLDLARYRAVYHGTIEAEPGTDPTETLDALFAQFNLQHPPDFRGHSLSVGDIVVLAEHGYVCDVVGWRAIPIRAF